MTALEIVFRYGRKPGPNEMRAINTIREVYGIRRIVFNEKESTVRLEYDASRLNQASVASLLRRGGIDITEQLALA